MSAIDDLISQIDDPLLRVRLAREWESASAEKQYGLLFEKHLPELLPLYGHKPRKGDLVCRSEGALSDVWQVKTIRDGVAVCTKPSRAPHTATNTGVGPTELPLNELWVVREFGQPIYPSLTRMGEVNNSTTTTPWHTLIEADNFHALQLLNYLYSGRIDCIYIDPPFNTGARDWKYNNDYVDKNDKWRHSKWLAFMERRLRLAQKLLNPDRSVLIIAVDDTELFTLGLLVDELFKGTERQIVDVTINPKGKARDGRLSQVDEYLIIIYIGAATAQEFSIEGAEVELRWPYLRRSDVESARGTKKGGTNQFYPIYVDIKSEKIVKIGSPLAPDDALDQAPAIKGTVPVFPIREDGKHMNWGLTGPTLKNALEQGFVRVSKSSNRFQLFNFSYVTWPSIKKINAGIYAVTGNRPDGTNIVVIPEGRSLRGTTAWRKNLYDANAYGSQLIGSILPGKKFPFPKSIYSVFDALRLFVGGNTNAIVLDFFAGSGTTLNAVNLLNAIDRGSRQCILVTNNEVSADEADKLRAEGLQPGDAEWEAQGICRSIAWPRCAFTISGTREDGTKLTGDYLTGKTINCEKPRSFAQIGFCNSNQLNEPQKRKQLVGLIEGLPQSLAETSKPFIVSDEHTKSVLFDEAAADDWIEALRDQDHITEFYIVSPTKSSFDVIKQRVVEVLGPAWVPREEKRPLADGFSANLAYFKLDFLDKQRVSLRRAFREILPLLWLKAGAIGKPPHLAKTKPEPAMFVPEGTNFVVLLEEVRLRNLLKCIAGRTDLSHVFIVTDSDEAFKSMAADVREVVGDNNRRLEVVQLYRDYLENFKIGNEYDLARPRESKHEDTAF